MATSQVKTKQKAITNQLFAKLSETECPIWFLKYLHKSIGYIFMHDDKYVIINKPKLQTDFCFGYGLNGVSTIKENDDANRMVNHANNDQNYFIEKNLEEINNTLERLSNLKKSLINNKTAIFTNNNNYCPYVFTIFNSYPQTELIQSINSMPYSYYERNKQILNSHILDNLDLINKYIDAYEIVKTDFIKRLHTYLKRYGLSKIHAWSYLVD